MEESPESWIPELPPYDLCEFHSPIDSRVLHSLVATEIFTSINALLPDSLRIILPLLVPSAATISITVPDLHVPAALP